MKKNEMKALDEMLMLTNQIKELSFEDRYYEEVKMDSEMDCEIYRRIYDMEAILNKAILERDSREDK